MKYHDQLERSAEYLRLAIPLMSKQSAGLHPMSYAIWYEYVSGMNQALRREMDGLIQTGQPLTEDNTQKLYQKYIVEIDDHTAKLVSSQLRAILSEIRQSAATTDENASTYNDSLQRCEQ